MNRLLYRMIFLTLIPVAAEAQGIVQSPAYVECTKLATTAPEEALARAGEWLKIDDGIPPHHCRAMALFGLQRFADAADALELVRDKLAPSEIAAQTYVTHQAAKAWMSGGKVDAALVTLSRQIDVLGRNKYDNVLSAKLASELLVERANIRSTYGQWREAAKDLDHAISLTPLNAEALLARAVVFQQLGDIPLAKEDAQSVLKLDPKNAKAKALLKTLEESRRL